MDLNTAKKIIGDVSMSDEDVSVLIQRAQKLAKNQHFWKTDDNPTDAELEAFYNRYEYEIYEIADRSAVPVRRPRVAEDLQHVVLIEGDRIVPVETGIQIPFGDLDPGVLVGLGEEDPSSRVLGSLLHGHT